MVNAYYVNKDMNTKIENVNQFVETVCLLNKNNVMIIMFITMMDVMNSVK